MQPVSIRRYRLFIFGLCLASPSLAQTFRLEKTIPLPSGTEVQAVAISRGSDFVAANCGSSLCLWSLSSGERVRVVALKAEPVSGAWFSRDGSLLAVSGMHGGIVITDLASQKAVLEFQVADRLDAFAISPDATLVAVAPAERAVEIRALPSGKILATLPATFSGSMSLSFSPDSRWLAIADSDADIRVCDSRTGALRSRATVLLLETFAVTFSADGKYVFAGGADGQISVIDASTGKIISAFPKQPFAIGDLRLSGDGRRLAATYFDVASAARPAPVVIWDVDTKSLLATAMQRDVTPYPGGDFLPDGRFILWSNRAKDQLALWSLSSR